MPISLDTWQPALVTEEVLRRLGLIKESSGYNTNPTITEKWEWPEQIMEATLPQIMVIEDRMSPVEGLVGGSGSQRGTLRMQTAYSVWGVVRSDYNVRIARHELLADIKSALFTGESLPTSDGAAQRALYLGIESVEYDGGSMEDLSRGFFVAELVVKFDMLRGE